MKFVIIQKECHPEFGGERVRYLEFELADFILMENSLKAMREGDCCYQHTTVHLMEKVD